MAKSEIERSLDGKHKGKDEKSRIEFNGRLLNACMCMAGIEPTFANLNEIMEFTIANERNKTPSKYRRGEMIKAIKKLKLSKDDVLQIWFNKVSDVEAEEWKEQEREGNFDRVLLTTVSQRAGYNGRKTALNTIFNNKTGTNRLVNPELLTNREMHLIARRLHLTKDELIDIFFCELFDENGDYIEQE